VEQNTIDSEVTQNTEVVETVENQEMEEEVIDYSPLVLSFY